MRGLLIAIQFLTIFPISIDAQEREFGEATMFFPIVGLLLGLGLVGTYKFSIKFFSAPAAAVFVVVAESVLTSALHLDGFIDTVDALASGKDGPTILSIFKDPHVGAKGVTAVILLLMVKAGLIAEMSIHNICSVLLVMPVLGRWLQVWAMALFPYIRKNGLATSFVSGLRQGHLISATLVSILIAIFLLGFPGFLSLVTCCVVTHFLGVLLSRRLGGLVGDIYGAFCEFGEVLFLILLYFIMW